MGLFGAAGLVLRCLRPAALHCHCMAREFSGRFRGVGGQMRLCAGASAMVRAEGECLDYLNALQSCRVHDGDEPARVDKARKVQGGTGEPRGHVPQVTQSPASPGRTPACAAHPQSFGTACLLLEHRNTLCQSARTRGANSAVSGRGCRAPCAYRCPRGL